MGIVPDKTYSQDYHSIYISIYPIQKQSDDP